jgi:hypothetical protein
LYCTKVDERVNELSLGVTEYMKYLVPVEEMELAAASSDIMSRSSLTQLPAVEQVRTLLREGMLRMREEWAVCLVWAACVLRMSRVGGLFSLGCVYAQGERRVGSLFGLGCLYAQGEGRVGSLFGLGCVCARDE